jgi:hypothetical protein
MIMVLAPHKNVKAKPKVTKEVAEQNVAEPES